MKKLNSLFEFLRNNMDIITKNSIDSKKFKGEIKDKILEFYSLHRNDQFRQLANEWHFWIFNEHIV
jgi:hypothetical protein